MWLEKWTTQSPVSSGHPLRVTFRGNCKFIYVSDESENFRGKASTENFRIALSLRLVFELTTFKGVDWDCWRLTLEVVRTRRLVAG